MTISLTYEHLIEASRPGGASVLTAKTSLEAAAGPFAGIAPTKFASSKPNDKRGAYAYEKRFFPELHGPAQVVVVDSKGSSANRIEQAIDLAILDGHELLNRTPRIRVSYRSGDNSAEGMEVCHTCLGLPHRAFDAHIRCSVCGDGTPVYKHPDYVAARNCTTANLRPLVELSAGTVAFGGWDATRKSRQVRLRSPLVGETIGVLADQSEDGDKTPLRGAARVDPVGASFEITKELATTLHDRYTEGNPKAGGKKSGPTRASEYGLGHIPPSLDSLGFVSCSSILRSHVLSFSTLRQYRFGLGSDGDAAVRALLAAFCLNGLVRAGTELVYRANCDLRETSAPEWMLDGRYGAQTALEPMDVPAADALLAEAIDQAVDKGLRWEGQVFEVTGESALLASSTSHDDEGKN